MPLLSTLSGTMIQDVQILGTGDFLFLDGAWFGMPRPSFGVTLVRLSYSVFARDRDLLRVVSLSVTKPDSDAATGFRWWETQHTLHNNIQCMHSTKMRISLSLSVQLLVRPNLPAQPPRLGDYSPRRSQYPVGALPHDLRGLA